MFSILKIASDKKNDKILRIFLVQVPAFLLIVTIYGLSVSILNDTAASASIALSQIAGDGVLLSVIGVSLMDMFNLFILFWFFMDLFFGFSIDLNGHVYTLLLSLITLLFNLISEALFFKFASCFNFPSNPIVVARSSLVILLVIIMLCVAVFTIIHYLQRGDSGKEKSEALLALVIILHSLIVLLLNAILIVRLKPQSNHHIQPSSLRMGFFNPIEMS
jgi:hypothetical protein